MNIRRIHPITAILAGSFWLMSALRCGAQTVDDAPDATPPVAGLPAATHDADGDADVPPEYRVYTHWHAHSGKAAECVVRVQFPAIGDKPALTMSGLVARCDGFLLVPRSISDRMKVPGAKGTISVIGAENETIDAPIPLAGWQLSASTATPPEYGLVKVNYHHLKCLTLLSGDVVKPGMTVNVVFGVDSGKPGLCTARSCTATISRPTTGQEHPTAYKEHFCLNGVHPNADGPQVSNPASSPNAIAASEIPLGAVVVDPETGAALGMVTRTGDVPTFQTMSQFGRLYNDVAVLPSRTALAARKAAAPTGNAEDMVLVPGGALRLQGPIAHEYQQRFHTDVACMPDFTIDVLPVTNLQYRTWMQGPGIATTHPASWQNDELNNPVRRQDLPVLGVLLKCALQYAHDQDKRMVTEVEWQRASYVKNIDWYLPIGLTYSALQDAWNALSGGMKRSHNEYDWVNLAARYLNDLNRNAVSVTPFPVSDDQAAQIDYLMRMTSGIDPTWVVGEVHPVGFYQSDVSKFGVRDAITNPTELMLPRGDITTITGAKIHPAHADPYLSFSRLSTNVNGPATYLKYFVEISPADGIWYADVVHVSDGGSVQIHMSVSTSTATTTRIEQRNGKPVRIGGSPRNVAYGLDYDVVPIVNPEFRCAR